MAFLTLAEARTAVADLLDDPNNVRFSVARIDRALGSCITTCLADYIAAGGEAFDLEHAVSSVAGVVDLSALPLLTIRNVQVAETGNYFWTLRPAQMVDRAQVDDVARALRIELVRDYALPSDPAHPLVGVGATAAPSWRSFDEWVVAEAALLTGISDNDRRPGLDMLAQKQRRSVLERIPTPKSRPLRLPGQPQPRGIPALAWIWNAATKTMTVVRTWGF